MPNLTAKVTETFEASGAWELVAVGGQANADVPGQASWALTVVATPPDEAVSGHPFEERQYPVFHHDISLDPDEHYWIRADEGTAITITVTSPAPE